MSHRGEHRRHGVTNDTEKSEMTRGETTARLCAALLCAAWMSACNITDPNPPLDGGAASQDGGGGDAGGEDARDEDVREEEDAGGCAEADKNACGGCATLTETLGASCSGCGELVCDGLNGLRCACDTGDNCGFSTSGQSICECADGYAPEAGGCVDVDECATDADDCDELTECTNTPGGFTCSACPAGTTDVAGDGKNCQLPFENVEVVRLTGTHPGNTSECLEVTCPAGKVALSGGFEGNSVRVEASRRSGADGSRWLICGFSDDPADWAVSAVCANSNADLVTLESAPVIIPAGTSDCVTRECPAGYQPIGGGGAWARDFDLLANQPTVNVDGWQLCGRAPTSSDTMVTVSVVCAQTQVQVQERRADPDFIGAGCLPVRCADSETFLGGGGAIGEVGDLGNMAVSRPTPAAGSDGPSWEICRQVADGRGSPDWGVRALCLPAPQ
jgi:hypothetical protein